jgi:hypothetical protein
MRRLMALAALAAAGLVVGCSSGEPETAKPLSGTEQAVLPVADAAALRALVAEQKGKVVVLAAWSVRQEGCVELYGELGSLCAAKSHRGPVVIAVNLDGPDDVREQVLTLVREKGAGMENRHFEGSPMDMTTVVQSSWGGQLPAVWVVYERRGTQADLFSGKGALEKAKAKLRSLQVLRH